MFPLTIFYFGYMFIPIFILVLRDITLLDTPIVNTYGTNQKENPGFKEREKERKEKKKSTIASYPSTLYPSNIFQSLLFHIRNEL